MAARHSVYDSDSHFIIDPITRSVTCTSKKLQLMQHDHNSERFTFEIPRYVEGHDMLECDVQIHYVNSGSGEESSDVYVVDDVQLSPLSQEMVIGSWLVSGKATKYVGTLNFCIRFVCFEGSNIDYQWFSDTYTGIKITKSIYNSDISESDEFQNPVLIESWKREILASIVVNVDGTTKSAQAAKESADQANKSATIAGDSANNAMNAASIAAESASKVLELETNVRNFGSVVDSKVNTAENAAKLSRSYAIGDTGLRDNEKIDNAKYYSQIANGLNQESLSVLEETQSTLAEVNKKNAGVEFKMDFTTGELMYESGSYQFNVNEETGNLEWEVN